MLDHALPSVLDDARILAAAGSIDTSPLQTGPMLFDLSDHDRLVIEGKDRVRFLHAMLSNDIVNLQPGQGRWATFNSVKGRTLADVRLFVIDDDKRNGSLWALLEPGARSAFTDGLDRFLISEKVTFTDAEATSLWLLAGESAGAALSSAGAELPPDEPFAHTATELGGRPVRLIRLDRSSRDADQFGLWLATQDVDDVLGALGPIPRGDRRLLEAARIEAGQPRFGIDLTEANIPLETGLKDRAISFTKGCYIGQEVICRIDSMGAPKRLLCRLDLDGDAAPEPGAVLTRAGKTVGWVTSAVVSQRLGRPVALGYVKKRSNEVGTVLEVPGGATATITAHC
jgi:folate-binding protein YgfZ